jgi:hypothetical protein
MTQFNPHIVALPHVSYDPSIADEIVRRATYSAWIDLEDEATLDLGVWPSRVAARRALRQYRAGGPKTYPDRGVLGTGFPYKVRKIERVKNVTLAWYRLPTKPDEDEVRRALNFKRTHVSPGIYRTLWAMPGTTIEPDATAATAAAPYSASLSGGELGGSLTVAIWPTVHAARTYIDGLRGLPIDVKWRQMRNVTMTLLRASGLGTSQMLRSE